MQRPCYQNRSVCTRIQQADCHQETKTEVVWTYLLLIRSGQNHLARHIGREKRTRKRKKEVGRYQGMDRPRVCKAQEDGAEHSKMAETGCEVIHGAPSAFMIEG